MVMKDEQWDEVIAVNLTSTFMLMRAAVRGMMRAKTGYGRIINISSVSGVLGNPGQGNYAASKAGMIGMTKSVAREVASRGITANCIAPGFIKTSDDRCAEREAGCRHQGRDTSPDFRNSRGHRCGSRLPCERRSPLCDRPDPARKRWNANDLKGQRPAAGRQEGALAIANEVC